MKYLSAKEMAEKWNVAVRRVQAYCADDKIPGAKRVGKQWIIPSDATRPQDGRFKGSKEKKDDYYHFPVLVHTRYYKDRDELNEIEQQLLEAQILHLQGELPKSLEICRKILKRSKEPYILLGTYFTLCFDCIFLFLKDELATYKKALIELCEKEEKHREDFKLAYAYLESHISFDSQLTNSIDISRLSQDALDFCAYGLILNDFRAAYDNIQTLLPYYELVCKSLEYNGEEATLINVHHSLGIIYKMLGRDSESNAHFDSACKLAISNNLLAALAKGYNVSSTDIDATLSRYGKKYVKQVSEFSHNTLGAWLFTFKGFSPMPLISNIDPYEYEYVSLVVYGLSDAEIAKIKGISKDEVEKKVKTFEKLTKTSSRKEFIDKMKLSLKGITSEIISGGA